MPSEYGCQRWLKMVLKGDRYERETVKNWLLLATSKEPQVEQGGFEERVIVHGAVGLVQPPAWLTQIRRAQATGLAFC